jgi:putative tryptophan/tyrosine transport system substrate-binding protein
MNMKRREFLVYVGCAVAPQFRPIAARAQQGERVRRIGMLLQAAKGDAESELRVKAFLRGLEQYGWIDGRNLQLEIRWAGSNSDDIRRHAAELVALAPDVLVAAGSAPVGALQQSTRTVPIVFATVGDPVGAGFVESLARPGGNITGFAIFEYAIGAKWLELLKEISPQTARVAVLRDPAVATGPGQFGAIQTAAPIFRMEISPVNVRDPSEIGQALTAFAQSPNGGLIVTGTPLAQINRDLIISLAARHKLPAVYFERFFVTDGGLISYGADFVDQYRRAGGYVHRILNGDKAADLPVQAPTKYELVINLKTAKALGLTVPPALLARADKLIE